MAKQLSQRQRKVGEQLRHIIGQSLIRQDMRGVQVNEVQPSPDLRNARVYVLLSDGITLDELQSNAYALQKSINDQTHLKFTPKLRFILDDTLSNARHIEDILREIPKPKTDE